MPASDRRLTWVGTASGRASTATSPNRSPRRSPRSRHALYPRLLPIARDWWTKLGRETPWPDNLAEWLQMCHRAGQTKSTPILLKYGAGDWNALHRDLYGELVFPLQVVINLNDPGVDHTGGEFLLYEQRPRAQSRGTPPSFRTVTGWCSPPRDRPVRLATADGRQRRSGTGCRRSGPAPDSPSGWSSTTPPDGAIRCRLGPRDFVRTANLANLHTMGRYRVRRWRRSADHYEWFSAYLETRGMRNAVRASMAFIAGSFSAVPGRTGAGLDGPLTRCR